DTGPAVVAAVYVGIVSGDTQDVAVIFFVVSGVGVKHDHIGACAAVGAPKIFIQHWPIQSHAAFVEYLEAGVDTYHNMVTAYHDVGVGGNALLGLGVINGLKTGSGA